MYKVTYPTYYTDTNPTIKYFDTEWEAWGWASEEIDRRINFVIEHSPYTISEEDFENICETEHDLVRIEKIQNKNEVGA